MYKFKIIVALVLLGFFFFGFCAQKDRENKNLFFIFNNGLNRNSLPFIISYNEQAAMLKKYGLDGIEHRKIDNIMKLKAALGTQGLKIYADYVKLEIDKEQPYLPEWKEVIPKLEGTGIILWIHVHSRKYKPSDEAADTIIVPILPNLTG